MADGHILGGRGLIGRRRGGVVLPALGAMLLIGGAVAMLAMVLLEFAVLPPPDLRPGEPKLFGPRRSVLL